eukprot:8677422-Pyramimonas_sp.AAC.1
MGEMRVNTDPPGDKSPIYMPGGQRDRLRPVHVRLSQLKTGDATARKPACRLCETDASGKSEPPSSSKRTPRRSGLGLRRKRQRGAAQVKPAETTRMHKQFLLRRMGYASTTWSSPRPCTQTARLILDQAGCATRRAA